jgi:hypothetical protein
MSEGLKNPTIIMLDESDFAILGGKIKTSVIEKFEFQDDGLVRKSSGFYGAEEPI